MNNIGITEGMGKKIVEALKKQSGIEIPSSVDEQVQTENSINNMSINMNNNIPEVEFVEPQISVPEEPVMMQNNEYFVQPQPQIKPQQYQQQISEPFVPQTTAFNATTQNSQVQTIQNRIPEPQTFSQSLVNFSAQTNIDKAEMENFDMPANVAVLKQLITQLPAGVTKQTGAQIIKQTMEALGISMKSVLQEAQQVQESFNNSSRECQANILEYKRKISLLEKQTQQYQKQFSVLNDIISLFIQTNNY